MSPSPVSLDHLIRTARQAVRRDIAVAVAGAALLVVPLTLLAAMMLAGVSGWAAPSPAPLVLEAAGLLAVVAIAILAWRHWRRGTDEADLAATAEEVTGLAAGSVLGVLELGRGVPAGTSHALYRREAAAVGSRFAGATVKRISGGIGQRARRRVAWVGAGLIAITGVTGLLGFTSPDRVETGWSPLLHPLSHLSSPPLPPMLVMPGDTEILRGSDLAVRIRAEGRFAITVSWRARGDVLRSETAAVLGDTAVVVVRAVDAPTEYWVDAPDGARSATYTITPRDPLLVRELTVVVRYPTYVGRAPDRYSTEVPPLSLPEGTMLQIDGRATRDLASASLDGEAGGVARMAVEGNAFSTNWKPSADGVFEWVMTGQDGTQLIAAPAPLEIAIEPDSPPSVEVTYPGQDTLIDATRIHAIAADARDDYGIDAAMLVSWRVSAAGRADPPIELVIPIDSGGGDRALVRTILDLRDRDVLPGDTIRYFVRVTDNSPRRQTAVSTTFALYLPGAAELRDRATAEADDMVRRAEELAQSAQELQDATRTLERRTEGANSRRNDPAGRTGQQGESASSQEGSLGFRESEQARQILEEQQRVAESMRDMRDRLDAIQRAIEDAGLQDPSTRQQLDELRELYDEMLTPDLQRQMDDLQQALDKLDPEQLEKALEQLTQRQQDMQDKLEESLEQLKRTAAEQRTGALAQEARELATQQQALSESLRSQTPTQADADMQQQLEKDANELASAMEQLSKDLAAQNLEESAQQAAQAQQDVSNASQDMSQAAQNARSQRGEQAAQAGEQAAEQLEQAATRLDEARSQMADASEREMREAMEQATNEALSLAQRQQALQDRMQQEQERQQAEQQARQDEQQQGQRGQQQGQQQQGQRGQQQGQQQQGQRGQQQGQQQQGQRGQQQGQQQQGQQQQGQRGQGQQGQQQGQQGQQSQQGQQGQAGGEGGTMQSLREEQATVQQGLEQLGRNLSEAAQQTGSMSRDIGAALGRANLSMQQTTQAMQQGELPTEQAGETVEALNRLALTLLNNQQQSQQQQNASGEEQAMQQLSEAAQQQGQLNGRSNALMPLQLQPQAMAQQTTRMAQEQREIADKLDGINETIGQRDDVLGDLSELAAEAERIARELEGGRLPADVLARQERLFHRLLDAGRTLERDETSDERVAERPGEYTPSIPPALEAALLDATVRYRVPTPDELKNLPPAYRKMILDYFERINRASAGGGRQRE